MCHQVTCRTCGKKTWAGCGRHADAVLARVPPADRCPGHPRAENGGRFSIFRRRR